MLLNRARSFKVLSRIKHFDSVRSYCSGVKQLVTTHLDDENGIFYIGLNSPEKRNAVNLETASRLFDAFNEFNELKDAHAGILYGNGGNFCAGFDLKQLDAIEDVSIEEINKAFNGKAPMGPSRMHLKKPVIAAISGHAVAGGFELALLCDLRIMEADAIVGVFCRRFGIPFIDGGTVRLPRIIGLSRALDLILTGRPVTAKEAFKMGLANRVVPRGESVKEAAKLAAQLVKFPQGCMLTDRESVYHATFEAASMEEALKFEYENGLKVVSSESIPGAKAFIAGKGRKGEFD